RAVPAVLGGWRRRTLRNSGDAREAGPPSLPVGFGSSADNETAVSSSRTCWQDRQDSTWLSRADRSGPTHSAARNWESCSREGHAWISCISRYLLKMTR